jgi:uncharacterized membrane protein YjjP (DUF1212 family)
MDRISEFDKMAGFIAEYAVCLLGCGVHTSRVMRNSRRIGESFGLMLAMATFHKSIVMTVHDLKSGYVRTEVVDIPSLPISFEYNSELSSLSWEAFDKHLPLDVLRDRFEAIRSAKKMPAHLILLLVGLANASFCRLFEGDWLSVGIVFVATLAGFFVRQVMQRRGINHFIVFSASAFVASMCASTALLCSATADIAIATSVLYLIPGVPFINGIIDIVEGHALTGCSRLIDAFLLVISIAVGLSAPLFLFKNILL